MSAVRGHTTVNRIVPILKDLSPVAVKQGILYKMISELASFVSSFKKKNRHIKCFIFT